MPSFLCVFVRTRKKRTQSDGVLWTSSYRRVYAFTVKNALWLRATIKIAQQVPVSEGPLLPDTGIHGFS